MATAKEVLNTRRRLQKVRKSWRMKSGNNRGAEGNAYRDCSIVDQLDDKTENDRARIIKLEKAVDGIVAESKSETYRTDSKVDGIVRIDESMQEETEKTVTRNGVTLFEVAETKAVEAKYRNQDDIGKVEDLLKSVRCEEK